MQKLNELGFSVLEISLRDISLSLRWLYLILFLRLLFQSKRRSQHVLVNISHKVLSIFIDIINVHQMRIGVLWFNNCSLYFKFNTIANHHLCWLFSSLFVDLVSVYQIFRFCDAVDHYIEWLPLNSCSWRESKILDFIRNESLHLDKGTCAYYSMHSSQEYSCKLEGSLLFSKEPNISFLMQSYISIYYKLTLKTESLTQK